MGYAARRNDEASFERAIRAAAIAILVLCETNIWARCICAGGGIWDVVGLVSV